MLGSRIARTVALGALVAAGLLAGCGDDDTGDGAGAPLGSSGEDAGSALDVVALDIEFDEDAYEVAAGEVQVSYENEGSIIHTLLIEGVDDFKLEVPTTGDTDEGSVELEAGTYTLYCDIAGHRAAGMEATLTVTG